jgi:hypothetical protein
MKIILT